MGKFTDKWMKGNPGGRRSQLIKGQDDPFGDGRPNILRQMEADFIEEARGDRSNKEDPKDQSPEDQFINNANDQENKSVIPSVDEGDARFLQNSINMFNETVTKKQGTVAPSPLLIDGIIGPKSKKAFKNAYSLIPSEMRRALGKKLNQG